MPLAEPNRLASTLPVTVLTRPRLRPAGDWQPFCEGPGYFSIPDGCEASIRIKAIDDTILLTLVEELLGCTAVIDLNLAENRKITDKGLAHLARLTWLESLNLSSCSLSNNGLASLAVLARLERLNISFCNRLTDPALKHLRSLRHLTYLDVQGCVKLTHAGLIRLNRKDLVINR